MLDSFCTSYHYRSILKCIFADSFACRKINGHRLYHRYIFIVFPFRVAFHETEQVATRQRVGIVANHDWYLLAQLLPVSLGLLGKIPPPGGRPSPFPVTFRAFPLSLYHFFS